MTDLTLSELLRGTKAGRMQSVGVMQIIPLLTDIPFTSLAPINTVEVGTQDFGTLVVSNDNNVPALVPANSAYLTKQRSQDHALPHLAILPAKTQELYLTAACVQQTQGGYMTSGQHPLIILPFRLRQSAFETRNQSSYQKLWGKIRSFNGQMGVQSSGHIDYFLDAFQQQLSNFVAEFELVPKQIGAIILVNGRVAGIERGPNYSYWAGLWPTLIRDCYGSYALWIAKNRDVSQPFGREPLQDVDNLDALIEELERAETVERGRVSQLITETGQEVLNITETNYMAGFEVQTVESRHFIGQTVIQGLQTVYASVIATEARLMLEQEQTAMFQM